MNRGLALMETIVSLFVLSVIFTAVLSLYPSATLAIRSNEQRLVAHNYARSLLADLKSRNFSNLEIGGSENPPPYIEGGTSYQATLEISGVETASEERLKQVRVTIQWQERGETKSVVQGTYVAKIKR